MADQPRSAPLHPTGRTGRSRTPDDRRTWDVVAAGRDNRDHLGLRLACLEMGLTALVVEPGLRSEIRGRRVRVTHADTAREDVLDAMRSARCVAVAVRDPHDPSGLEEVADAVALGKPLVIAACALLPEDLAARRAGVVVDSGADDPVQAWVAALGEVLADPDAWSAARLGEWRAPSAPSAPSAEVAEAAEAGATREARPTGALRRPRRGALAAAGVAAAILPPLLGR